MGSAASASTNADALRRLHPEAQAARVDSVFVEIPKRFIDFVLNDEAMSKAVYFVDANMIHCIDADEHTRLNSSEDSEGLISNANLLIRSMIKRQAIAEDGFLKGLLTPLQCALAIHLSLSAHKIYGMGVAFDVTCHIVSATLREISLSMAGYLTVKELHCTLVDIDRMLKEEALHSS